MKALETKSREGLEKARELLKEQLNTSPFHRTTPLYNLACVESLLGDKLEKALEYLQEAIASGWNDVNHIKNDTDLDNLRGLDGYKALVASLEADSSSEDDEEIRIDVVFPNREAAREARDTLREEARQARIQAHIQRQQERAAAHAEKVAERIARKEEKVAAKVEAKAEKVAEKIAEQVEKAAETIAKKVAEVVIPAPVAPAPAPAVVPAPASPAPAPASPAPTSPAPVPALSASVQEFESKLTTLTEMGFNDRRRNIMALIQNGNDLVSAVQWLLTH